MRFLKQLAIAVPVFLISFFAAISWRNQNYPPTPTAASTQAAPPKLTEVQVRACKAVSMVNTDSCIFGIQSLGPLNRQDMVLAQYVCGAVAQQAFLMCTADNYRQYRTLVLRTNCSAVKIYTHDAVGLGGLSVLLRLPQFPTDESRKKIATWADAAGWWSYNRCKLYEGGSKL